MEENLSKSIRIQTPEGIEFSLPLAGPVTRFTAWLADLIVILAIVIDRITQGLAKGRRVKST